MDLIVVMDRMFGGRVKKVSLLEKEEINKGQIG